MRGPKFFQVVSILIAVGMTPFAPTLSLDSVSSGLSVPITHTMVHLPTSAPKESGIRTLAGSTGLGYTQSTLCMDNNTLLNGNALCNIIPSMVPNSVAVDPVNHDLYISNKDTYNVSVFDPTTDRVISSIPLNGYSLSQNIVYDNATGDLYVSDQGTGQIGVINATTNTLVTNINLPSLYTSWVTLDTKSGMLFVTSVAIGSENVTIVNPTTNSIVGSITVGLVPVDSVYVPVNNCLYVTVQGNGTGNVTVINATSDTVITVIPMGLTYPRTIGFDPADGDVYVVGSVITVISATTDTIVATLNPAATNSWGGDGVPFYDPANADMYIPDSIGPQVLALRGTTILGSMLCASAPFSGTYDPTNGLLYVTGVANDTLSIVAPGSAPSVNFLETGLPVGTYWLAALDGISQENLSSSLNFSDPNGTYPFTVSSTLSTYAPSPASGTVTVQGKNLTILVNFTEVVYNVTFKESGLPAGSTWGVTLNGQFLSSSTASTVFHSPNGTFSYNISSSGSYAPIPPSGSLSIGGRAVNVSVRFVMTYTLTLQQTGLLNGTLWQVTINGSTYSSKTLIIKVSEPNGSYSFSVGAIPGFTVQPSSGTLWVNGTGTSQSVVFTLVAHVVLYPVTFAESGLTLGTTWGVVLNGTKVSSVNTTVTFTDPNGTYGFTIGAVAGYSVSPTSGNISVRGGSAAVSVMFTYVPPGYSLVTFSETGLPSGASWSVTLAGKPVASINSTIFFSVKNGTFAFNVTAPAGMTASPAAGSVVVAGAPITLHIAFTKPVPPPLLSKYPVNFLETGLPSGLDWSVDVNETVNTSSTSLVGFFEPVGTYPFMITSPAGYTVQPSNGTFVVSSSGAQIVLTFTHVPSTSPTGSVLPIEYLYMVTAAAAALLIVGIALSVRSSRDRRQRPPPPPAEDSPSPPHPPSRTG